MVKLETSLPDTFLDEEIRNNYAVSSEMKKIWAVEIDLLCKLDEVCGKHGIKYFADGGTLLGAVREGGFIPWDDDIDIVMFREEFERLLKVANEFSEPYFFQCVHTENEYVRGHAQLRNGETTAILYDEIGRQSFNQGVFIDIFILDGISSDADELDKQKAAADTAWKEWIEKIGQERIEGFRKWESVIKKHSNDDYEYVAPISFIFETEKRIRRKSLYDATIWLPFEFIKIPVPAGYDEFLRHRYGDYMKPEKIPTTHGGVFFDTDVSYKDYIYDGRKTLEMFKIYSDDSFHPDRDARIVSLLDRMLEIIQVGISLTEYLKAKGVDSVAIYGMGVVGRRLYNEVRELLTAEIDRSLISAYGDVPLRRPEDDFSDIDLVIITPVHGTEYIKNFLEERSGCTAVSLDELLNDALGRN